MTSVYMYRYDLTDGMIKQLGPLVNGKPIEGIWHTSLQVYGKETYFGRDESIVCALPRSTHFGQPCQIELLGTTTKAKEDFLSWIEAKKSNGFGKDDYDLIHNNCNHFTQAGCQFLLGQDIPEDVRTMIPNMMASPFGKLVASMLEQSSGAQRNSAVR